MLTGRWQANSVRACVVEALEVELVQVEGEVAVELVHVKGEVVQHDSFEHQLQG